MEVYTADSALLVSVVQKDGRMGSWENQLQVLFTFRSIIIKVYFTRCDKINVYYWKGEQF